MFTCHKVNADNEGHAGAGVCIELIILVSSPSLSPVFPSEIKRPFLYHVMCYTFPYRQYHSIWEPELCKAPLQASKAERAVDSFVAST